MNPSPQSREVPVTAMRSQDGMTKHKGLLVAVRGILDLGEVVTKPATDGNPEQTRERNARDLEWTHKPAKDDRPQMWRSKYAGVEIWLKGEIHPDNFVDEPITGDIEVKLNEVTGEDGGKSQYLYVNVLPSTDKRLPIGHVFVMQPLKEGSGKDRRKVLPLAFDPETDFVVERGGQPWQVILVRPSLENIEGTAYTWFSWEWKHHPPTAAIAEMTAKLSFNGPAKYLDVPMDGGGSTFVVITDSSGTMEMAQAIWEYALPNWEEFASSQGRIRAWPTA